MPTDVSCSHGQAPWWRWQPTTLQARLMNKNGLQVRLYRVFCLRFMAVFLVNWEIIRRGRRAENKRSIKSWWNATDYGAVSPPPPSPPPSSDICAVFAEILFLIYKCINQWGGGVRRWRHFYVVVVVFFFGWYLHTFASGKLTMRKTAYLLLERLHGTPAVS